MTLHISAAGLCELHPMAAGALAERVLPQHGAGDRHQPRDVPGPCPHPQPLAHGDCELPGAQVRASRVIFRNNSLKLFQVSNY